MKGPNGPTPIDSRARNSERATGRRNRLRFVARLLLALFVAAVIPASLVACFGPDGSPGEMEFAHQTPGPHLPIQYPLLAVLCAVGFLVMVIAPMFLVLHTSMWVYWLGVRVVRQVSRDFRTQMSAVAAGAPTSDLVPAPPPEGRSSELSPQGAPGTCPLKSS